MNIRELIQKWITWKSNQENKTYPYRSLALDAGINPNYLSNVMTGVRNPGAKTLRKIAGAFGVSMSEFYAGPPEDSFLSPAHTVIAPSDSQKMVPPKDFPLNESNAKKTGIEVSDREKFGLKVSHNASRELDTLFSTMGFKTSDLFVEQSEESNHEIKSVDAEQFDTRIQDTVQLVDNKPRKDRHESVTDNDKKKRTETTSILRNLFVKGKDVFVIRMEDDSMIPDLTEGDILIIDPEMLFKNIHGGIGVIRDNDRYKVRRIYNHGDNYILVPSNPRYEPEIIPGENITLFKVALWIPRAESKF